jgi:hypothetical protein
MRILILYNAGQTYTSTVFEHLDSFRRFSIHEWHYLHYTKFDAEYLSLSDYQAFFIHYSVRLPFDQISESTAKTLSEYKGIKGLFIQDEYDNVNRTKYWLNKIVFDIVFTVVPQKNINEVYPSLEFPDVKFINNLTGYAPAELNTLFNIDTITPPSKRNIVIGYRGRNLPIRYGVLGQEKIKIGEDVRRFCKSHKIKQDIQWDEHSRIYGQKWYEFLLSCKAMLGSESGSNVFDWHGDLHKSINEYKKANPKQTEQEMYCSIIKPLERDGLMNQVSPRIFEMAASCTVMILYEGSYSNIIQPNIHYLPLKKDLSNLPEIVNLLDNDNFVDAMALRARSDIIDSGNFGYPSFINLVDQELVKLYNSDISLLQFLNLPHNTAITTLPIKGKSPILSGNTSWPLRRIAIILYALKDRLPVSTKTFIKRLMGRAY